MADVIALPVTVPDKYAALAQEEKRFTHVSAPRLGRLVVEIADSINSSTATESDAKTARDHAVAVGALSLSSQCLPLPSPIRCR